MSASIRISNEQMTVKYVTDAQEIFAEYFGTKL